MAGTSPDEIFQKALEMGASDVHVAEGVPITFRLDGDLKPVGTSPMTAEGLDAVLKQVLSAADYKRFHDEKELDVSYIVKKSGMRLRLNCHFERGFPSLVARLIPSEVPTLEETGMDRYIQLLGHQREGLILFTGPTGTGKSTSMSAVIDYILDDRAVHVITLEDPIEFLFDRDGDRIVRQRQFGEDFHQFGEALKRVLRQDPDVVMVGEMRDLEIISAALTLAETGHLVLATLHTPNAMQTIDRIIDVFPPHQQSQVRNQLSMSLKAIVAQRLLVKEGGGRVPMREILINTPAVAHIIRDDRIPELVTTMQIGSSEGMQTFDADTKRLLKEGLISQETYDQAMGILSATTPED